MNDKFNYNNQRVWKNNFKGQNYQPIIFGLFRALNSFSSKGVVLAFWN